MRTLTALAIVLAAIAVLRALLVSKGWIPRLPQRRSLRLVETLALGGRQRLVVVEAEGERLLLGVGDAQVAVLKSLGPAAPEPEPETPTRPVAHGWRRLRIPGSRALRRVTPLLILGALLLSAPTASAQSGPTGAGSAGPSVSQLADALGDATDPEGISSTLQAVAILTLLSIAPSILLMATCFTRVVIVLAFLRQAIGVQQLPPNQVLIGLALFVTLFVMAPVGERIHAEALDPYMRQEVDAASAAKLAAVPVREYLAAYTREDDIALFESFRGAAVLQSGDEIALSTLLPSFLLSELRTAFEIGFMLYLPFLVIDLVIASMLISMGMIVLPPVVISLPFKLMLFVLLDGWNLVVGSLLTGLG